MTVNDITLRSQSFVESARQGQDQRRDQANANIGNTIQGFGNQLVDMHRYEREFALKQQAMQQELAMQRADADMRLALQQQEMQSNQYKLQQMAQIDAVDAGRMQLDSMKLDYEMRKYEFEERKKAAGPELEAKLQEVRARTLAALGGARGAVTFGYDPLTLRKMSESERDEALKRVDQVYGSDGVDGLTATRRDLTPIMSALSKAREDLTEESDPQARESLKRNIAKLQSMADELSGGAPAGGGQATQQPKKASPEMKSKVLTSLKSGRIQRSGGGTQDLMQMGLDDAVAEKISTYLEANKAAIGAEVRGGQAKGREGAMSDDDAVGLILQALSRRGAPEFQGAIQHLMQLGVLTQYEASALLN